MSTALVKPAAAGGMTEAERADLNRCVGDRFHDYLCQELAHRIGRLYRNEKNPPDLVAHVELCWQDAADRLAVELAGEQPTFLETLLAEEAAVSWLDLQHARLARQYRTGGASLVQAAFLDRSLDRAQRRFLASLRSLAAVRRLDLTVIQATAQNLQVNVNP